MRRLVASFFFILLSVTATAIAATDFTGTWSGTYSATHRTCNPPLQTTGALTLELVQSGNALNGVAEIEITEEDCKPATIPFTVGIPISGTVSGDSFSGSFVLNIFGGQVTATVNGSVSGNTMTLSFEGGDAGGTATLTRTSSSAPDSRLSGLYDGSYTAIFVPCIFDPQHRLAPITHSGTLSGSLTQTGANLSGVLTVTGLKQDHLPPGATTCTVTDSPPVPVLFTAQVSGNIVTGVIVPLEDDEEPNPFLGTISGTTITGHVDGSEEPFDFTISRTSTAPPAPAIVSFTATPSTITAGESSTLSWSTLNATGVNIDNGVGGQPLIGSMTVRPTTTTTYRLTATGTGGTVSATATVNVGAAAPSIGVSSFPRGMVQVAGQGGGSDSFSLTNAGTAATDLTLSSSGSFFTVSPTSFNLAAGATQTISVIGNAQSAGFFEGSVAVNGNGASGVTVPIRLLSATPPSGPVTAAPTVSRSDVSAPAGQNPSGSVNFTNSGSTVLQGIAVADVPWIIPQSGVITIQPGQAQAISFTIDSSKRPDAASPLGGVTGKITLVFISGTSSGKTGLANPPTSNVSVTIVYVVAPGVTAGSPPPLGASELALFVPGLQNRPKAVGDLLIANKQSNASLSDLKLYFQGTGVPSQIASLPQIGANGAVALPGLLKNIFATSAQSGSAQIRGGDLSKVAVSAVQFNNSSPSGTFGTALPVLRSDRGVAAGGQLIVSGVFKESGIQTDLYVQELTGNAATVQIDFLNESGSIVSSRPPDSLQGFGFLELIDAVPTNTMSVRIRNTSSGAARINAYGLVINANSGDRWTVTDPVVNGAGSDDTFIFPVLSVGSGTQTIFYATNRTAASASVTVDTRVFPTRRRPVAHSTAAPLAVSTFNLGPYESLFAPSVSSSVAYIRIQSAASAMSVNARSVRVVGANAFGSGLPALPASGGVAAGELKRFAGVEDASSNSRSTAAPGTFRTNLILIEASNQPATVRVTLRYSFIAGAAVSATAVSSKEYSVGAAQFVAINDVARDVIGSARDSFGDLHNMELDVEVTGGSGRVLPFLLSIDNGSGDSIVRTE